ncbi:PPK2 family polyphosphate:nucleotide phosphotransferase [Pseudoclavibacter chungangensis]|nr:polyphosphate kinase 2 family protein [Pseudoclavibacter chungangensis]NYJ67886.1 PPK2 family polyphosphate:nucleotide phosphotransferase [Pseudoclavibacter chungangensis]
MPHFTKDMAEVLRVGETFRLSDIDPSSTPGFDGTKKDAAKIFDDHDAEIAELQERMYANARADEPGTPSILLVLQGMDTSGKGGIIRHVVGGVDPQGVRIASFKAPTDEERAHDFLWRIEKQVPPRGIIGVFDRSHYEDVLIQRVRSFAPPEEIERRYGAITEFEEQLASAGTHVVKVMLHISKEEQGERLAERLDRPDKYWKYNPGDVDERELWPAYQEAYDIALRRTSTTSAPWYCVPANRKWYARLVVKGLLLDTLRSLDLGWPPAKFDVEEERRRLAAS